MKTKSFKPVTYALILAFGVLFTLNSCEKSDEPMDLPPAESLKIDFSTFPENTDGKKSVETVENWFYSAGNILVWNVGITLNIAIPIVAYAEAFNHEPVFLGDNSWEWAYDVVSGGFTYNVSLVGTRIDNETFSMEMTVSSLLMKDFKWISGIIRYDYTEANWTLQQSPRNPVDYLTIDYDRDFETESFSTKYEVVDPQNELYEGYIEYGMNPENDMDAYYKIFMNDTTTNIEWNTETTAGRVKDNRYFEDTLWHCWDTQLQDVDCPAE